MPDDSQYIKNILAAWIQNIIYDIETITTTFFSFLKFLELTIGHYPPKHSSVPKYFFFRICSYFEFLMNFLMIWLQMWTIILVFIFSFFTIPLVLNIFSFFCLYFHLVDLFLILSLFLFKNFWSVDHLSLWALFFILSCDLVLLPISIEFSVSFGRTVCFTGVSI